MRQCAIVLAGCLLSLSARADAILNLGDPAPPLAVSAWIKGEKIEKFEPGKVYVVDFWATWCIPCRPCYPHLSELARKYKAVRFVGIDIWEARSDRVKPFVEEMGAKMDFSIATDAVPESGEELGAMARTWMKAAEEHAIPTAFIISDRKIAWIGHPQLIDEPLAKIIAGGWHPEDMAKARLVTKTRERKLSIVRDSIYTPYNAGEFKDAVAAIAANQKEIAGEPELVDEFTTIKFAALCNGGDVEAGLELGNKLFEANKDKANVLNFLASHVTHKELVHDPDPRVASFALKASQRAVELTKGEHRGQLEILAQALLRAGDPAGAVVIQEQALKLLEKEAVAPGSSIATASHASALKRLNENLDRYRNAVKVKASRP